VCLQEGDRERDRKKEGEKGDIGKEGLREIKGRERECVSDKEVEGERERERVRER